MESTVTLSSGSMEYTDTFERGNAPSVIDCIEGGLLNLNLHRHAYVGIAGLCQGGSGDVETLTLAWAELVRAASTCSTRPHASILTCLLSTHMHANTFARPPASA